MRLLVFNASPRGARSNSLAIIKHFLEGFEYSSREKPDIETVNLINERDDYAALREKLLVADRVVFAFPLYVDSMPGFLMEFFETLILLKGALSGKEFLFSIQCGFPETLNLRPLERYLVRLTGKFGAAYAGCICRGGMEGTRYMPADAPIFRKYRELGMIYAETGKLDPGILGEIANPEKLPRPVMLIASVLGRMGLMNGYWKKQLKKNGAYEKRHARPYDPTHLPR